MKYLILIWIQNQIDNFQDGKSDLRVANVLTNIYKQNCI